MASVSKRIQGNAQFWHTLVRSLTRPNVLCYEERVSGNSRCSGKQDKFNRGMFFVVDRGQESNAFVAPEKVKMCSILFGSTGEH